MQTHPQVFESLMCTSNTVRQTSDSMKALLKPEFSVTGSNQRLVENQIFAWWLDLLQDVEGIVTPDTVY